jgi:hypothetical protein
MKTTTIKEILLSTFAPLHFEEESHTYEVDGRPLDSVSKKLGQFYESFDKYAVVGPYTAKWNKNNPDNPKTEEEVLEEWDRKRIEAAERGTKIHLFAESYPDFPEAKWPEEQGIIEWYDSLPDHYEVVCLELQMFGSYYAGTADIILLNTKTGNLVIADWKTNKDLFKNFRGKRMKSPFKMMLDSPYNHYKLQLNHYKMMIEDMTPFTVEDMWCIWLKSPTRRMDAVPMARGENFCMFKFPNLRKKLAKYYSDRETLEDLNNIL